MGKASLLYRVALWLAAHLALCASFAALVAALGDAALPRPQARKPPLSPGAVACIGGAVLATSVAPLAFGAALSAAGAGAPALGRRAYLAVVALLGSTALAAGVAATATLVRPDLALADQVVLDGKLLPPSGYDPVRVVIGSMFAAVELLSAAAAAYVLVGAAVMSSGGAGGSDTLAAALAAAAAAAAGPASAATTAFAPPYVAGPSSSGCSTRRACWDASRKAVALGAAPATQRSAAAGCSLQFVGTAAAAGVALGLGLLLPFSLSLILPPGWALAASTFAVYARKRTLPEYTWLDPAATVSLGGVPVFLKLYVDVGVYFATVGGVLALGVAASFSPPLRRVLSRRVALLPAPAARMLRVAGAASIGELCVLAALAALFGWWTWYWGMHYTRIQSDANVKYRDAFPALHVWARATGHLATLAFALALFPAARGGLFDAVLGVSFDAVLAWHRGLGALAWLAVTTHGALWVAKWAQEGIDVPANLLATGVPRALLIATGRATPSDFTIPLVVVAWAVMTAAVLVAACRRRLPYELFTASHYSLYFVLLVAELHAWSHWYHTVGALALYAVDKIVRTGRGAPPRLASVVAVGYVTVVRVALPRGALGGGMAAAARAPRVGCYAFVCAPEIAPYEWHPVSLAKCSSISSGGGGGGVLATFCVRSHGPRTWSGRLLAYAAQHQPRGGAPSFSGLPAVCDDVESVNALAAHRGGDGKRRHGAAALDSATAAFNKDADGPTAPPQLQTPQSATPIGDRRRAIVAGMMMQSQLRDSSHGEAASGGAPPPLPAPILLQLDGCYGGLPLQRNDDAALLIIAGGIGVTPFIGLLAALVRDSAHEPAAAAAAQSGAPRLPTVTFVWTVPRAAMLGLFADVLGEACDAAEAGRLRLDLQLHVTKADGGGGDGSVGAAGATVALRPHPPSGGVADWPSVRAGVSTYAAAARIAAVARRGRPRLGPIFARCAAAAGAAGPLGRSATRVLACGPPALMATARRLALQEAFAWHGESFGL